MKILLVEDRPEIIESVTLTLELRWPEANLISTSQGAHGVELAREELPEVVILDIGLPDMDGLQVLRQIRGFSNVPVIMLTVKGDEIDKIKALELGADDYVVKPFSAGEFLARVKAALRRSQTPETKGKIADRPFIRGNLRIDFASHEVSVGEKLIELNRTEYDLLCELVRNEGTVVSSQALLDQVWGPEHKTDTEYLKVCIKNLNEKLGKEPGNPTTIIDEGGKGYKFLSR